MSTEMDIGRGRGEVAQRTGDRDARDDLRATADAAARAAERLAEIERRKLSLDPHDPELQRLTDEASDLSRVLTVATQAEVEIAQELGRGES